MLATSHLQGEVDLSPTATGFAFLQFSLCVVAGSTVAPALIARLGARSVAVAGLLDVGAAMLLFTRISAAGGVPFLVAALALSGASLGFASVAATGVGTAEAGAGEQGLVAGLLNTATQIGTAIGIAVLTTTASARAAAVEGDTPDRLVGGFQTAYLAAAAIGLAGDLAAAALLDRDVRNAPAR